MRSRFRECVITGGIAVTAFLTNHLSLAEDLQPDRAAIQRHAEESLQRVEHQVPNAGGPLVSPSQRQRSHATSPSDRPDSNATLPGGEDVLTGHGQGDLQKGRLVCQRVSELAARTDLAKQIRVLVKEHATDRVRERTGREAEQDIEVIREEIVQEYLQGVKIVDRRVDEEQMTCSATAVMSKSQIQPQQASGAHETLIRP
ncbi:MAG: hypothetical protein ABW047_09305 [Nitrospiraceae bacterium]